MKRNYSIDILRIIAMCAVVMIHVYANFPSYLADSIAKIYADFSRWAVPVFIMISGAFLLQRKIIMKSLYGGERIFKLLYFLLFWNCIYWIADSGSLLSLSPILYSIFAINNYHLYFLYILIILYVISPILQSVVFAGYGWYYVIIWFIIDAVLKSLSFTNNATLLNYINSDLITMSFGYSGYFVLGNMLLNSIKKIYKFRYSIYIVGLFALILYVGMCSSQYSRYIAGGYFNVLLVLFSISIFTFFLNLNIYYSPRVTAWIKRLSLSSLGVYLVHPLVISVLQSTGFDTIFTSYLSIPFLSVFIMWLIVVILSYLITYILKRWTLVFPEP